MKRYRFRLEQLLALRHAFEQTARAELASALAEEREREGNYTAALASYRRVREMLAASSDVATFCKQESWLSMAAASLSNARSKLAVATERREQARIAWMRRSREVEALERLKERYRIRHEQESMRQEAIEVDSIVSARFRAEAIQAAVTSSAGGEDD